MDQDLDCVHPRGHHRRAHSDTAFRLDDLLLFDPSDLDLSSLDLPTTSSNPNPPRAAVDSSDDSSSNPQPLSSHRRSLSVDSDFFDGLALTSPGGSAAGERRIRHRHSNSMDGAFDLESMEIDGVKKAMGPDRLAELALIDPKRAKRILANRQSAARSKERKIRYTSELERKVQTLQAEATNLSAQVTMLQRDTSGWTTENKELKLRLQAMEQQAKLRDALSEALREELQQLKITAARISAANGNAFSRGLPPQFPHQPPPFQVGICQTQQQQQQQQQVARSVNNQGLNGQPRPHFMDFNQRA